MTAVMMCIEVLEHIDPAFLEQAVSNVCQAALTWIVFSSTPGHKHIPEHVSVHDEEYWVALFRKYGFEVQRQMDARFVSAWALIFRRVGPTPDYSRASSVSTVTSAPAPEVTPPVEELVYESVEEDLGVSLFDDEDTQDPDPAPVDFDIEPPEPEAEPPKPRSKRSKK